MQAAFLVPIFALTLNPFVTVALVFVAGMPPLYIMYSVFNLILGYCGALYIFMTGYKGLATCRSQLLWRYVYGWAVLLVLMAAMSGLAVANLNGWVRVVHLIEHREELSSAEGGAHLFWLIAATCEASCWSASVVIGAYAWILVLRVYRDGPAAITRYGKWLGR